MIIKLTPEEEAIILEYMAYLRSRIAEGIYDDFDRNNPVAEVQAIIDNGLKK